MYRHISKYKFLFICLLLTGCATHFSPDAVGDLFGFFSGLWHGLIFILSVSVNLLSWFLSLFGISFLSDIQIIGRPNTGFGYYCGFILGLLAHGSANN